MSDVVQSAGPIMANAVDDVSGMCHIWPPLSGLSDHISRLFPHSRPPIPRTPTFLRMLVRVTSSASVSMQGFYLDSTSSVRTLDPGFESLAQNNSDSGYFILLNPPPGSGKCTDRGRIKLRVAISVPVKGRPSQYTRN